MVDPYLRRREGKEPVMFRSAQLVGDAVDHGVEVRRNSRDPREAMPEGRNFR